MIPKKTTCFILLLIFLLISSLVYGQELNGWIKSDTCWVVRKPSGDATAIGIIRKKAHVTVKDVGGGWLKIIFAPIRDPLTGKWLQCTGCFIQKINFTTQLPSKW